MVPVKLLLFLNVHPVSSENLPSGYKMVVQLGQIMSPARVLQSERERERERERMITKLPTYPKEQIYVTDGPCNPPIVGSMLWITDRD